MARDFWKSTGFHLVERDRRGWLKVTPDLLRAYYTRPEIHPVEDSCAEEHLLFEALMNDPFLPVDGPRLAALADRDAAENYALVLGFREHLVAHRTVEAAYRALFSGNEVKIPPVFVDQLAGLVLRNILDEADDPMRLRAGELFFREQTVSTDQGQLILADAEIVETFSDTAGLGGLGALLVESGTPVREVSLDVLTEDNKHIYWSRSDRFDTAIDFRFTQPALDAFCRVVESWIGHFFDLTVRVQPVQAIRDDRWSWHIGLDSAASRILNALYQGEDVAESSLALILALLRMEIEDQRPVIETVKGKPVWLGLAMDGAGRLKMKPQNLLINMPLQPVQ